MVKKSSLDLRRSGWQNKIVLSYLTWKKIWLHTHTHTRTQIHTRILSLSLSLSQAYRRTHTLSRRQTDRHARTQTDTHIHSHSRTNTHAHTRTHSHRQLCTSVDVSLQSRSVKNCPCFVTACPAVLKLLSVTQDSIQTEELQFPRRLLTFASAHSHVH